MISTREDRLEAILQTRLDAAAHFEGDLAAAATAGQRAAIEANRAVIGKAYQRATDAALNKTGPAVEAALIAAQDALTAVEQARQRGAPIADLIRRLNRASRLACDLLRKAESSDASPSTNEAVF